MNHPMGRAESTRILPTYHRDEHSRYVGFPVGAEALSEACQDVAQWGELALHFFAGGGQQQRHLEANFPILAVGLRRPKEDDQVPRWFIEVFAVPVDQKNAIRKLLVSDVLPRIVVPWLRDHYHLHEHTGSTELRLDYDATTLEVTQQRFEKLVPPRR